MSVYEGVEGYWQPVNILSPIQFSMAVGKMPSMNFG
jgi:hypothetical protein